MDILPKTGRNVQCLTENPLQNQKVAIIILRNCSCRSITDRRVGCQMRTSTLPIVKPDYHFNISPPVFAISKGFVAMFKKRIFLNVRAFHN